MEKNMALTPMRRVITGSDERGKSKFVWGEPVRDKAAPGIASHASQ